MASARGKSKKAEAESAPEPTEVVVTGFKGFDSNLQCIGYQFEVGRTFEHSGAVRMCSSGFHFIEGNPLDVLDFYPLVGEDGKLNRFCSVTAHGEVKRDGSTKSVTGKLTVQAELKVPEFISSAVKFVIDACKAKPGENVQSASGYSSKLAASGESSHLAASGNFSQLAASGESSQLAASGESSQLAASGDYSQLAASGNYSQLAASGESSQLAASGYSSKLAASGDYSKLAASGNSSKLAASGESSHLAASGNSSHLAASGDYSQLAASGYSSKLAASGKNSVIASSAPDCTASGADGTWISLAEFDDNYKCIGFATGQIGKDGLKPNTAYRAKGGKLVEVESF